jgi:hypothetical protein
MSGPRYDRILASTALALILAAPLGAFAQDTNDPSATFNERYPAEQTSTQTPPGTAKAEKEQNVTTTPAKAEKEQNVTTTPAKAEKEQNVTTTTRVAPTKRPRSHIVVEPRSFLDAGTEVLPGERKFTDYAFPPTHNPLDVVQNTGGRVGWHRSPLPGPFDLPGPNNPFGW